MVCRSGKRLRILVTSQGHGVLPAHPSLHTPWDALGHLMTLPAGTPSPEAEPNLQNREPQYISFVYIVARVRDFMMVMRS